jgi:hypothetical protein
LHNPAPQVIVFTPQTRVFTIPLQSPTDKVDPQKELTCEDEDEAATVVCACADERTVPLSCTAAVGVVAAGVSRPALVAAFCFDKYVPESKHLLKGHA